MTGIRAGLATWWRQLRDDLGSEQTRALVGAAFLIAGAVLGALIWGQTAINVVFGLFIMWLLLDRVTLLERTDAATDDADKATKRVEAVENHLSGVEPQTSGRHSRGQAA